jgi:hypothetical protein
MNWSVLRVGSFIVLKYDMLFGLFIILIVGCWNTWLEKVVLLVVVRCRGLLVLGSVSCWWLVHSPKCRLLISLLELTKSCICFNCPSCPTLLCRLIKLDFCPSVFEFFFFFFNIYHRQWMRVKPALKKYILNTSTTSNYDSNFCLSSIWIVRSMFVQTLEQSQYFFYWNKKYSFIEICRVHHIQVQI